MPVIVTASQLRTVLGVSVSLYSDSYLDEIVNTAEAVILPMLVANTSAVTAYKLDSNVAYYYTQRPHHFVAGQSIIVTGLPAPFSATVTVVKAEEYYFTAAITNANVTLREIIPTGTATLSGYSAADIYATSAPIESAVLAVSVEVFQSRVAAGGEIQGVDFASTPYRMGRSLTNRVSTLLQPFLDVETVCQ
jgi:cytochrome c biogenesis protein CcdA